MGNPGIGPYDRRQKAGVAERTCFKAFYSTFY